MPGSAMRAADGLRTGVLARVDGAAQAAVGGDRERARERLGREARLVAGHVEADDVRVAVRHDAPRDLLGALDAAVAQARGDDPRLDAEALAGVVDALGDRVEVLLVGEADGGRVVGRGDELDVDRALLRAAGEVLERDVAVVLAACG